MIILPKANPLERSRAIVFYLSVYYGRFPNSYVPLWYGTLYIQYYKWH